MVNCPSCGAQNLDNAKYCCQCAAVMGLGKREFVPMCGEEAENSDLKTPKNGRSTFQNTDDFSSKRPVETSSVFALENSSVDDDADDYAKFRMRDSSEVFNGDESNVFSKNSRDAKADKKRKRDSAKLVKRAEKKADKKRRNGEDDFDSFASDWQGNDFWN